MRALVILLFALVTTAASAQDSANGSKGGPYGWTTMGGIKRLPNGGRPDAKSEFPEIHDWKTLKITLQRTACFGRCPIYSVEIRGDGSVEYSGQRFVAISGTHRSTLSDGAVSKLVEAFKSAQFFWLFDSYAAPVTDNPAQIISISFDDYTKTVRDYVGRAIGMPKDVIDLEELIDEVAGTKKWVAGNNETIPALKAEKWAFSSTDNENIRLLLGSAETENTNLTEQLLGQGVPAKNKYGCLALSAAAEHRNVEMAKALLDAGAPIRNEPIAKWVADPKTDAEQQSDVEYYEDMCDVLQSAAVGAHPEIMRLVLLRKPDVNQTFPATGAGRTPLMFLSGNSSNTYAQDHGANFGRSAELLILAGADVNLADDNGNTALMGAENVELVRVILAAGVKNINASNNMGQTALMRAFRPDVIEALLEAGADPYLQDRQGRTALDHVKDFNDPALRAVLESWIQAHPKPAKP